MRQCFNLLVVTMTALLPAAPSQGAGDETVDVELVLAVDVSLSMLPHELEIQRRGYAEAIIHPHVLDAIAKGIHRKIAVTYVEWAGTTSQRTIVPWTLIDGPAAAVAFSGQLTSNFATGMRRTSISAAIDHSVTLFDDNGFRGLKRVIDVSGDGPNNQGRPVSHARDDAIAKGIVINGLPLMTLDRSPFGAYDIEDLDMFYTHCVIGGAGSFMVPVNDWDQFAEAIRRKLIVELADLPPMDEGRFSVVKVAAAAPYDCLVGEKLWQQRRWPADDN